MCRIISPTSLTEMNCSKVISLVICTRNRAASLARCLEHVRGITTDPSLWELIVVDNASTDETPELLEAVRKAAPFVMHVVHEPRAGLGQARNAGVARVSGEIIAFTDDDCYVTPNFLDRVLDVFKDDSIGFMGGRILLFDPTDDPLTTNDSSAEKLAEPYSFIPCGFIQGANMALRRSVIEALGGFDPCFGTGTPFWCDDVDLIARASIAGWRGGYFPEPVVYHHHGRKPGLQALEQGRYYDVSVGAYFAKFLVIRNIRYLYLKNWYWRANCLIRRGQFSKIAREFRGAIQYWLLAARRSAFGGHWRQP